MLGVSLGTFASLQGQSSVAAPLVTLQAPDGAVDILETGPDELLTQPAFFQETRNVFLEQKLTFIEADLSRMELVHYFEGTERLRVPIISKGIDGSWWETPAGLYDITQKSEHLFSEVGQVYQPYSMVFQGNFLIHGWPEHVDGAPVEDGYSAGGIRLATTDAAALYEQVEVNTPVLVHEQAFVGDDFVYEVSLPEITAEEYLVADIANNTILAASDMGAERSIASVTKLMTALVAAEYINLDETVQVAPERFVTSVIPRLERHRFVSMYSLLQLLLVESSNEAAEVIAAQVGREQFISLMNKKAKSLGLSQTVFTDPSGLDSGNTSTISDLFRLSQYIYHNRSFVFEITAKQDLRTAYISGQFGVLDNFNEMDNVKSFVGGKVGFTDEAGQTNVSLHEVQVGDTTRVIAVILLGSEERTEDVKRMLAYIGDRYGE